MSEQKTSTDGLMKIGELAKAANVNVSTLKFYVKEELIRPALKTGRNMSWYSPDCVATIRAIRMLQRERFYPLSVIKHLLSSSGAGSPPELALLDAIHKVDYRTTGDAVPLSEAARRTRLTTEQIRTLLSRGIISGTKIGRKQLFTAYDISIMGLIRRRMEAGIPFEQSASAFEIYSEALCGAVQEDIRSFIDQAIVDPAFSAEEGAKRIRISDETLDNFIDMKRRELNRIYGSEYLELLYGFGDVLRGVPGRLAEFFSREGLPEAAAMSLVNDGLPTGMDNLDACVKRFNSLVSARESDISCCISKCAANRDYFAALDPEGTELPLCAHCFKVSWLCTAPSVLRCTDIAAKAFDGLLSFILAAYPEKGEAMFDKLRALLTDQY